MTDGGRGRACLSARELIRAGVCVHLTELLLLDEGVDIGVSLLEGLEGLGEDGILFDFNNERGMEERKEERKEKENTERAEGCF